MCNHLQTRVRKDSGAGRQYGDVRSRSGPFVKPGERAVEVSLVERLAAVDPVAFDSQKLDKSPLGVEAFW